jgi:hypothetical protein
MVIVDRDMVEDEETNKSQNPALAKKIKKKQTRMISFEMISWSHNE